MRSYDSSSSQLEIVKQETEETRHGHHYTFPISIPGYVLDNNEQPNASFSYEQTNSRMQNIDPLSSVMIQNPRSTLETLPGATRWAHPQHLGHPYLQQTFPLGHFTNMDYSVLPPGYMYMPSGFQQEYAGNSLCYQSPAIVHNAGMKYTLEQYKDNVPPQQNDGDVWVQGPGSRTVPVPPNSYYNSQGQSQSQQRYGYRQGQEAPQQQHFVGLGYPNVYHSWAGVSQEYEPKNPNDGARTGTLSSTDQAIPLDTGLQ